MGKASFDYKIKDMTSVRWDLFFGCSFLILMCFPEHSSRVSILILRLCCYENVLQLMYL